MNNVNQFSNSSTSQILDSILPRQVDALAARSASAKGLMQSQYQDLSSANVNNPFAASAGFGLDTSRVMNPSPLQQDFLRRQGIARDLTAASASPSGFVTPSLPLRSAKKQVYKGESAVLMARDRMPAVGFDGILPGAASTAGVGGLEGLGSLGLANRQRQLATISMRDTPTNHAAVSSELARLSAETYQSILEAESLARGEERKTGDTDLAHETEFYNNQQRHLVEEALATQERQAVATSMDLGAAGLNSLSSEREKLFRRQQQEAYYRRIQTRQLQMSNRNLLGFQSRIDGAMSTPMTNPSASTGDLRQKPSSRAASTFVDEQTAIDNMEKAYSAKGSPENETISKFLNVVMSHVPEITDNLTYCFPVGLVDNAERFHTKFPHVVEATLEVLRMIQDRASKRNGYKSRGLYDRVTKCIAALAPYRIIATNSIIVAMPSTQDNITNTVNEGASSKQTKTDNEGAFSKPSSSMPLQVAPAPLATAAVTPMPWTCHKCGHDNLAIKARCSACRGWKGGVRENKPKHNKRKQRDDQSADGAQKEVKNKKQKVARFDDQESEKASKSSTETSGDYVLLEI